LKYSQLIQILRVNPANPAITRFPLAIGTCINRGSAVPNAAKTAPRGAKAGFAALKSRMSGPAALYAALTLSRGSVETDAWKGRALGKTADAVHACGKPMKKTGELSMKRFGVLLVAMGLAFGSAQAQDKINPTDPQPTCPMCPGTYIPSSELEAYTKKALDEKLLDQQVRDIDIGKAHIGLGMVHRGRLEKPAPDSVAEHDQISEVYHVISGAATLVLGPDILNRQRRPATMRTVVEFNGPGNNGSEVRNGVAYEIKAGDVVVIPAGTGHWFTKIDDHIDYIMVRIDPDKVTPLKSEAQSQDYLSKPARKGE
jgi:mannose-6-phosphate isomerase-like protein (cupin superfamily)